MNKRKVMAIIIVIAVILLVLAGWYVMFVHFGKGPAFPFVKFQEVDIGTEGEQAVMADDQLMASAETEEKAREIAEQYGIEFVSFENGLALFRTEENPFDVIARGKENGYPELSINFIRTGYKTE